MPSQALSRWQTHQKARLDQLEAADKAVGGTGPGRRYATQQINHAYLVLLAAQWQDFCRNLHSEAADALSAAVQPASLGIIIAAALTQGRNLDRGNASPSNIGSDFGRFGLDFWAAVDSADKRNGGRRRRLEQLNIWRNGVAHQDFQWKSAEVQTLVGTDGGRLGDVQQWRRACDSLARQFDQVLGAELTTLTGAPPW